MSAQPKKLMSPEEYLAIERKSPIKHEYYRGEMYAMSGASREHNLISVNIAASLHAQLAGKACETYAGDMRVKIPVEGIYVYPDLVVTCEKPKFEDSAVDTLLNPQVVIEISSASTENYDRGRKFAYYRQVDSLREYILVSQNYAHIDRFFPGDDGVWRLSDASGLDGIIELPSIDCRLKLADVYAKVEFPPEDELNRAAGLFRPGESR
jgi:Uma2 family endonuclease